MPVALTEHIEGQRKKSCLASVHIDDVSEQLLLRPCFADTSPPRVTSPVDASPAGPSCDEARASETRRETDSAEREIERDREWERERERENQRGGLQEIVREGCRDSERERERRLIAEREQASEREAN
jgi:hypothetical protein